MGDDSLRRARGGRAHGRGDPLAVSGSPDDLRRSVALDATDRFPFIATLRGWGVLAGFVLLTLPLMPVQAVLKRVSASGARALPFWYHRQVCRLLGIRLTVSGQPVRNTPVLLIANHSSWLDIPVLSAAAPVSFIAKREVGTWPGISALARLQRTVFVDRERRTSVGETAREISDRLAAGDTLVLFAEGTSSDGNRVLPFRSSLFGAVIGRRRDALDESPGGPGQALLSAGASVQTVALVYTRRHGVPLGRAERVHVGWYGDMDMIPHAWTLLRSGPLDVTVAFGPPVPIGSVADRKALARSTEAEIRGAVAQLLRSGGS